MVKGIKVRGEIAPGVGGLQQFNLYMEGQKDPVYTTFVHNHNVTEELMDTSFLYFLFHEVFYETVTRPSLRAILERMKKERESEVPWHQRTHRLLPLDRENKQYEFIITTDKSDVKRYLEGIELSKKRGIERKRQVETLREKRVAHKDLISLIAKSALQHKSVAGGRIRAISDLGLLTSSTAFRQGALYPDEKFLLQYDFAEEGKRYCGYLGFNVGLELVTLDQRFPEEKREYFGKRKAHSH